jgi:hypothetical protein
MKSQIANKTLEIAQVQPSVASMIQTVIDKGITADNVKALEALVGLKERMDERDAKRAFAEAFVALQSEMPTVAAKKAVPNANGSVRYTYAPFADIMAQVQPVLKRCGFAVSFSTESEDDKRVVMLCTLSHIGGHSQTTRFAARIGKGPPGSSESQGDGAASTYAKRFALCNALNIVIGDDNDARAEGNLETITSDEAKEFSKRCIALGVDSVKFLAFAKAETFEQIQASRFTELDAILKKKGG